MTNTIPQVTHGDPRPAEAHRATPRGRGRDPRDVDTLRIALLTYRGTPTCGGQGVYVAGLAGALRDLGHDVEVFSGAPAPALEEGSTLHVVRSADDPPDAPAGRAATLVDRYERRRNRIGFFAEPLGFSWRVGASLRERPAFDVIHDNQSLGYGLLALRRHVPVTATIHHPLSVDYRMALEHTEERIARVGVHRFYKFTTMQARVARRLDRILTVSERSRADITDDFGVPRGDIDVVPNAIDATTFRPRPAVAPVEGRIVTTASSDQVLKGLDVLLRALVEVRRARPSMHLVVVGTLKDDSLVASMIRELDLSDVVTFTGRVSEQELVELYASAEVACVPSRYEGFSLPAAEAMACGVPLVSSDGGALAEVAGPHGDVALVAPAGDAPALAAHLIEALGHPRQLRATLGERGRRRVLDRWTRTRTAERTVDHYRAVIDAWSSR